MTKKGVKPCHLLPIKDLRNTTEISNIAHKEQTKSINKHQMTL